MKNLIAMTFLLLLCTAEPALAATVPAAELTRVAEKELLPRVGARNEVSLGTVVARPESSMEVESPRTFPRWSLGLGIQPQRHGGTLRLGNGERLELLQTGSTLVLLSQLCHQIGRARVGASRVVLQGGLCLDAGFGSRELIVKTALGERFPPGRLHTYLANALPYVEADLGKLRLGLNTGPGAVVAVNSASHPLAHGHEEAAFLSAGPYLEVPLAGSVAVRGAYSYRAARLSTSPLLPEKSLWTMGATIGL